MTDRTETTVTSVLRDPIIIFGLALIMLGVILLFTLPTETPGSFPLYIGIGLTAGRLSRMMRTS